jgi:hypothetical protein
MLKITLKHLVKTKTMKKVLIAAFLLVSSNAIFAQVNQGQWLVGGSADFNFGKQGDTKTTMINVAPDAGYFFIDQLAGGLRLDFGYDKTKTKTSETSSTSFGLAPFVRYYFMPSGQKVNVFADGSYGFGSYKPKGGSSASINYYAIKAGPAVFLTPNTALEFAVYYKSYGGDFYEVAGDRYNQFGLGIGFQIHLGGGAAKK